MPQHRQTRTLPQTPDQLYELIADVDRYPEFLPWCVAARVRSRSETRMRADLMVGFNMLRERYTSDIVLEPKRRIVVSQSSGPFRRLENVWEFAPAEGGGAEVAFFIDFEFRSSTLQRVIQPLFSEATRRMVAAFEDRAMAIYGPGQDG